MSPQRVSLNQGYCPHKYSYNTQIHQRELHSHVPSPSVRSSLLALESLIVVLCLWAAANIAPVDHYSTRGKRIELAKQEGHGNGLERWSET